MNWILRTLGGAVLTGVGWKLGSEAYEFVKKRIQERNGEQKPAEDEDAGVAATDGVAPSDVVEGPA